MVRVQTFYAIAACFFITLLHLPAQAQSSQPVQMIVNADQGEHTISRHLYGHFAEHLGRGIYDGFWQQNDAGEWHLRQDVVDALKQIQVPNLRWPGGCFADYYHWKDGIGPREDRPTIVNNLWGGVTEDNSFGTHEFMALVEELGTEPVIVGNVGSGTVQEMSQWWEYMNHPGQSPMADLRRANGQDEPWNVKYWGVGNESWGCGGNMTPEYYADLYKRFATYLHNYGDVRPYRIAAGPPGDNLHWMEVMMRDAGQMIDGIDVHHYTLVGDWTIKGSATDFGEREWMIAMQRARRMDDIIRGHSAIMDRYDPQKRVALIIGEWGMWHDPAPGSNPGFLYQQNTLRDAIVAAVQLDIFNAHADRVRMANIAQTVNVLQAMILTEGDAMLLTPTYHVFEFYTVHHDATLLPMTMSEATYTFGDEETEAISATASQAEDGTIHLTLTNVDPNSGHTISVDIRGREVSQVTGRILTAADLNAHNTFDAPETVKPEVFSGARLAGDTLTIEMPPKSIVVLELR